MNHGGILAWSVNTKLEKMQFCCWKNW